MILVSIVTIVHVIVCVFLVIVVLLQSGKAADLAGAFGGMGSQTAFGPRGAATVLSKATTIAAGLFMVTSLTLSVIASRNAGTAGPAGSKSVLDSQPKGAPATTSPAPGSTATPQLPGGAVAPGAPSVTLEQEGTGVKKTIPVEIPPPPAAGQPAPQGQQAPPPPPKK